VSPSLRSAGLCTRDAVVVAGGHDHPIGGWGVDQLVPGAILDSMGTAEVAVTQTSARTGRQNSVDVAPGILSGGTTLLRVEELSRNVAWAAQDRAVAQQIRELLAGSAAPLPVLESGFVIPGQRGGGRPAYAPDAPRDPRARASAVLGALAVVGRDAVSALQGAGASGQNVCLAGGWSRYPGWLEIKAAVNGFHAMPIAEPEVTAVGRPCSHRPHSVGRPSRTERSPDPPAPPDRQGRNNTRRATVVRSSANPRPHFLSSCTYRLYKSYRTRYHGARQSTGRAGNIGELGKRRQVDRVP
jgi:hypothetical protein